MGMSVVHVCVMCVLSMCVCGGGEHVCAPHGMFVGARRVRTRAFVCDGWRRVYDVCNRVCVCVWRPQPRANEEQVWRGCPVMPGAHLWGRLRPRRANGPESAGARG